MSETWRYSNCGSQVSSPHLNGTFKQRFIEKGIRKAASSVIKEMWAGSKWIAFARMLAANVSNAKAPCPFTRLSNHVTYFGSQTMLALRGTVLAVRGPWGQTPWDGHLPWSREPGFSGFQSRSVPPWPPRKASVQSLSWPSAVWSYRNALGTCMLQHNVYRLVVGAGVRCTLPP